MTRPPERLARPTFGSAASGRPLPIASSAASAACSPAPWLAPTAASLYALSRSTASWAETPPNVSASSSKVSIATIGRLETPCTASIAVVSSSRSKKVSTMNRSTPRPSSSPACSAKTGPRSSAASPPSSPSGPIEPATKTSRPEISRASRASLTPVSLMAATSSSRNWERSLWRLAPNVLVSISSAPALMKLACRETTLSGARMFASSGQRKPGTALETSTPMPPSVTTGGPCSSRFSKRSGIAEVNHGSQPRMGDRSSGGPRRYSGHIPRGAPMRRGRSGIHSPRRPRCGVGHRRYLLRLSHGRLRRGRAAAPPEVLEPKGIKRDAAGADKRANDLLQSGTDGNHPAAALELKVAVFGPPPPFLSNSLLLARFGPSKRFCGSYAPTGTIELCNRLLLGVEQAPLHPARDDDHLACHVAGELVRGENDDLPGHVFRLGDLAQRH